MIHGRLAPSPTGVLHLGNARTFLLAWLSVRSRGGILTLRIEDIDGPRIRAGAEAAALEDLAFLGLHADGDPVRQTDRLALYRTTADRLVALGLAYPCVCSRTEIENAASAPHGTEGPRYPGTCRARFASLGEARAATGRDPALRFRVDPGIVVHEDGFRGRVETDVCAETGDFVIMKRDGTPAYQLAVVVDDAGMGITEVLRGDDLLSSTGRQILLYRALGRKEPQFIHVPLVVGEDGRRLAKRHGDTTVARLRREGIGAARIVSWLADTAGLPRQGREVMPPDLVPIFDLRHLPRDPVVLREDPFAGSGR